MMQTRADYNEDSDENEDSGDECKDSVEDEEYKDIGADGYYRTTGWPHPRYVLVG